MKIQTLILILFTLVGGSKSLDNMENDGNYYILQKNNRLMTIVSLINPYVYATKNKEEVLKIKEQLEVRYLRNWPIDSHFDHREVVCDEEMIRFDKFLLDSFGFSFLSEGFNHDQNELNGQVLYGKKFPEHLSDKELLDIQLKMDKYHFKIIEQEPNGKSIIVLNPWAFDNPLRDSEFFVFEEFYNSKSDAQKLMDVFIEEQFDLDGTYMTVGYITESDLTDKTKKILDSQPDIRYKPISEDYGQKFVADKKLSEIENGMEILMNLFESVNKTPYEIVELK